jgi:hypothetical protein
MTTRDLKRQIEDIMTTVPRMKLSWRKKAALAICALTIIAIPVISGASQASGQSDWVGTWTLSIKESAIPDPSGRSIGPNPYRTYRIHIERPTDRLRISKSHRRAPAARPSRRKSSFRSTARKRRPVIPNRSAERSHIVVRQGTRSSSFGERRGRTERSRP